MAGSIKWFKYTTDEGTQFALRRDESNLEAVNGAIGDYVLGDSLLYSLPGNVTPRSCVFTNGAGTIRRDIVCLTIASYNAVVPSTGINDDVSGENLVVSLKKGESIKLPKALDTALDDGDAT